MMCPCGCGRAIGSLDSLAKQGGLLNAYATALGHELRSEMSEGIARVVKRVPKPEGIERSTTAVGLAFALGESFGFVLVAAIHGLPFTQTPAQVSSCLRTAIEALPLGARRAAELTTQPPIPPPSGTMH